MLGRALARLLLVAVVWLVARGPALAQPTPAPQEMLPPPQPAVPGAPSSSFAADYAPATASAPFPAPQVNVVVVQPPPIIVAPPGTTAAPHSLIPTAPPPTAPVVPQPPPPSFLDGAEITGWSGLTYVSNAGDHGFSMLELATE